MIKIRFFSKRIFENGKEVTRTFAEARDEDTGISCTRGDLNTNTLNALQAIKGVERELENYRGFSNDTKSCTSAID